MNCQHCKSGDVLQHRINKHGLTRLYCKECRKYSDLKITPKLLLLDIEVSHGIYKLYAPGKQTVGWKSITERAFMLGWCAKWLYDSEVKKSFVTPKEAINRDDERVTRGIHALLSKADLVIAHNGNSYDLRKLNWFFALHNLEPNNRYQSIDTYRRSRDIFGAESLSLGYLLKMFGFVGKASIHAEDWEAVENGDPKAIKKATEYCVDDVLGLEDLYLKIRPWMRTHPNLGVFAEMYQPLEAGDEYCPRCLQTIGEMKWNKKYYTLSGQVHRSCNCPHCGAVLRQTEKMTRSARVK